MKKKTGSLLKTTIAVLLICAIAGVALSAVLFLKVDPDRSYASATLQFTFDGAAEGKAPNGYHFDIRDITSDEVLSAALTAVSMDSRYTPEQIRPQLVAKGVYPENIVEQIMNYESLMNFDASRTLTITEYHPTLFNITLYKDFDASISNADLSKLLTAILNEYRTYFAKKHAVTVDPTTYMEIFELSQYDYPQQLNVVSQSMRSIARYAEDPYFKVNGVGFNDYYIRMNKLLDNDVARLEADLTIHALTKNTERLLTQYQFEIQELNNELTMQEKVLQQMDALIASYEKNEIIYLSTTDSLTKIDGNSSETYDYLVEQRKKVSDEITDIKSELNTYRTKLEDLSGEQEDSTGSAATGESTEGIEGTESAETRTDSVETVTLSNEELKALAAEAEAANQAKVADLEANIASLTETAKSITNEFRVLLDEYNKEKVNELTIVTGRVLSRYPKLVSGAFIKRVIKTAGPIFCAALMICLCFVIASQRKKMRLEKAA